ncbi:unnamed protein product [Rotaria sp. Silwood1]|nr:unnamed protein product [Rotaria sp. Silwood1]
MKTFHHLKTNENESIEMNSINDPSLLSKEKRIQQKFFRTKHISEKWKNSGANPLKSRRRVLSKALINTTDSLIQVNKHNYNSPTTKNKHEQNHDRITINISGKRYQTYSSTLENYPNTLLGNKQKRMRYWNEQEEEYFFDRHRACFEAILYYYQSNGRLRRPDYVPLDTFLEEVSFFDLGSQAVAQINKSENVSMIKYINLPNWFWRRYIWFYLEYPQHSIFARILHSISMLLTVISCITLAIETLPQYNNLCINENNITSSENDIKLCSATFSSPFFIIQTICVSYFIIEFILRLISTPSYYKFILSIYNWLDLCAIVPYFIFLGLELYHYQIELHGSLVTGLRVLRILRFLRLVKLYLIFNQLKSLRVLSSTLKESFTEFIIMMIILTLLAFMFGAATYFAEENTNGQVFDSIPKATYWGIITITTTGILLIKKMAVSSSSPIPFIPIDPRIYCETMNELHSYITSSKRGYLTQAELFRYYRQRHDNVEIPYRLLGYRSLLDLLSSDQRLFAIDLRREPAYIYSAVKLRQQKRERRQGSTSFSRQHHSTNTLDEQHIIPPDYVFFDHHVPLNEHYHQQQQQQQNIESSDEHEQSIEIQTERPLTPNNHNNFDNNVWHTPQLDEQTSLMDNNNNNINSEERNKESIQFTSNPFLPLPPEINDSSSLIKCENQYKPIQRKIIFQHDNNQENKFPIIRDVTLLKFSTPRLNRSISTSTTSLSKSYSWYLIDSYIFLFAVVISFIFLSIYLYKLC